MKGRLFNLLTIVSLVACVAVVVLWVWSSFGPATWVVARGPDIAVLVRSAGGSLHAGWQSVEPVAPAPAGTGTGAGVTFDLTEPGSVGYRAPGAMGSFANGWYLPGMWSAGSVIVTIPPAQYRLRWGRLRVEYWLVALLTAAAPVARGAAFGWRRSQSGRRRGRHCARCGYDLTGNVSGVCPECGSRMQNGGG